MNCPRPLWSKKSKGSLSGSSHQGLNHSGMLPHPQNQADDSASCWDGPSCWENRKAHTRDEDAQIGKDNKGFQGIQGRLQVLEARIRANRGQKKHLKPTAWEMWVDTGRLVSGNSWYWLLPPMSWIPGLQQQKKFQSLPYRRQVKNLTC